MKRLFTLVVVVLTATTSLYAQLSDFSIVATPVAQTCMGNGSLTFTVAGNNPAAALEFAVYLLPNTTVPFTTVTTTTANNLIAGNYLVVATQTLNSQSNSATANATIDDNTVQLAYTLSVQNSTCDANGIITVNVTSGTAVGYEIISGPETFALQPSNVFEGLAQGQYQVRVHDNCGDAFTTTVQVQSAVSDIDIKYNSVFNPSCNTIGVNHYLETTGAVAWPLEVQYTVYPPDGSPPVIIAQQLDQSYNLNAELPLYEGAPYYYSIRITDACGNEFVSELFIISAYADFNLKTGYDGCTPNSLIVEPSGILMFSLTLNFVQAPAGFNPQAFNASYPEFANQGNIVFQGDVLPYGVYTLEITDACGRVVSRSGLSIDNILPPQVNVTNNCQTGDVQIIMPGKAMTQLLVTAAPEAYEPSLPYNLLGNSGPQYSLQINNLPAGSYTLLLDDECGFSFTIEFVIEPEPVEVTIYNLPGCDVGYGSVRVQADSVITSFIITGAPETFTESLPFDATGSISWSDVYMGNLPEGEYTYTLTVESCDEPVSGTMDVIGFHTIADNVEVIPNCGSFDLKLQYLSSVIYNFPTFWLQRYDEAQGVWVNPQTGNTSDIINAYSAIQLENSAINYNLPYTGQFRIVMSFMVYNSFYINDYCYKVIEEFTYTGAPQIEAAYGFPCDDGLAEVILVANGVDPLTYEITSKNGASFEIDNGTSNDFISLEEAVYNFRVTDACNNVLNVLFDVSVLRPIQIEGGAFCEGQPGRLWLPEFTFLLYEWYKADDPDTILSTGSSLDFDTFSAADEGLYMVHIESVTPGSCIDMVLQYNVYQEAVPLAGDDGFFDFCGTNTINLNDYLSGNYMPGGIWQDIDQSGQLNGDIVNGEGLQEGIYRFNYVLAGCNVTDTAIITFNVLGDNAFEVVVQAGCVGDDYIINITNSDAIGPIESIEWEGPDGFSQNGTETFIDITNGATGTYYVTVTTTDGCTGTASLAVENTFCEIPKGISPNGDGLNDSFDLSNLEVQHLIIFNRYGMKVYEANDYIDQWHGQSDSGDLPTGTYYYVATLSAGKQKTGWVYLQREVK